MARIAGTTFSDEDSRSVDAENFCQTVNANVGNKKMTDKQFREFIRKTLPVVRFERVGRG